MSVRRVFMPVVEGRKRLEGTETERTIVPLEGGCLSVKPLSKVKVTSLREAIVRILFSVTI